MQRRLLIVVLLLFFLTSHLIAAEPNKDTSRGDRMLAAYFKDETAKLTDACLADIRTLDDWQTKRDQYRQELYEMLGMNPLPERTDLHAEITGKAEHDEFVVENVQFQSRPGLYVTGNLYVPKKADKPLPAILYVCGHGRVAKNGISYGNKTHYQHHGAWFARNGYVCLTIDTLQLGEIEGIHHGTYRYNMWWWLNRGYTSAGVEAWNCIRALDYLQSRAEVDGERLGVTGRSGGGAYSWWIAALDERIKCAVPVAGITDLTNHVVDGCVEGHCDCMYMVNTYRWDYTKVAALVAPRPLLISNTDTDGIFPLDGVYRTFEEVRRIYRLYNAGDQIALNITAGGHKDTQELRVHAFRWFNHHLRNDDSLIEKTAVKLFEPEQLRVFAELPADQKNTEIHESFVPVAEIGAPPADNTAWKTQRDAWMQSLKTKCFAGWPTADEPLDVQPAFSATHDGITLQAYDFTSQGAIRLRLYMAHREGLEHPELTVLNVMDETSWQE
ncbi:MAG: prolyl oligopeptidase family serine peptidase, partial [Planctomycetales bacterium]|nr:prolyl oligopeptidase family serine peptidase [Planctomycetales bacterium]